LKHKLTVVPFVLAATMAVGISGAQADYPTSVSTRSHAGGVTVNVEVNSPTGESSGYRHYPAPEYRGGDLPPPPDYRYAPAPEYGRRADPSYCDYFARREADRYASPGNRPLAGAARGALRGAAFGHLVGSKKEAKRGAAIGAAIGLMANGARNQREQDYAYTRAYEDCMRDFRR